MIKCLSEEVQGKLRSGVAIPSLQQSIEELILNSIDAEATCVGVRVDMEAFKVQVVDNGAGMTAEDMECVGNRYYTSKCSTVGDLDNLRWYGFRGEALASVVSLATLVEISARTRSSVKTHIKIFKGGKGMDVFEAESTRPSSGTTVVVCNFLHNMPVRRKRMDAVLEGERIRHRVEAISLMHPSVSFTLKNDCTGAMTVQLPKARSTYHRFVQIHGLGRAQKLGEIGHTRGQFEVTGYIGREGHYNNSLQFLYVNERLLLKTRIHKLLNLLLRRLSCSNQKTDSPDGQSATRSPKHKRSQELHGVYVINIKCLFSEYDICLEPAKTLIEFRDWDEMLLCIEEAVKAFLSKENLVAVLSQDDLDYVAPNLFSSHNTDQEGHNAGHGDSAAGVASSLDCTFGMKLASNPVYRRRKDDCAHTDSVGQECGPMEGEEETAGQGKQKINSVKSINKESRSEPLCDLPRLEATSDNNITVEEESTVSDAGEDTQVLCLSNSLESEKLELSQEKEIPVNTTLSAISVIPLVGIYQQIQPASKSIDQILPDCQGSGGREFTSICNRRISLSDPYIHENLLPQDLSQINKSVFQPQVLVQKCEERSVASKRKISLCAGRDGNCPKPSIDIIPSKMQRISTCQKLSLCKEPGSLEKFRRTCGPADELKLPSQATHQGNNPRRPQTDGGVLNSKNMSVCQKEPQDGGGTEKEETRSFLRSPFTLKAFAKLKPVSGQNRGRISLAAKLFHLKRHGTDDSNVLPHLSRTTSRDDTRLRRANDDGQDGNNSESHCATPRNPETAHGCCESPPLAEGEEDTTSGDWLHHYDASVGKIVYINRVTGLSRYQDPPAEETLARCTSDVTNMAVSVISERGELAAYPQVMLT